MKLTFFFLAPLLTVAGLCGCATPLPAVPLSAVVPTKFDDVPADKAQLIFLVAADVPEPTSNIGLFDLDGEDRKLEGVFGAHTGSMFLVSPGHHFFMTYGRKAHLMEANVLRGGCYYVLLRSDGSGSLQAVPVRDTSGQTDPTQDEVTALLVDMDVRMHLVEKTPAADIWFASQSQRVDAAQRTAFAEWQRRPSDQQRSLTLNKSDFGVRNQEVANSPD